MNPQIRVSIMVVVWVVWLIPFFMNRARGQGKAVRIDPRARLGILITAVGYFLANVHGPEFWNAPLEWWRAVLGVSVALCGIALVWMAVGNLGKQWRVDAGLNADHELVRTGAYRVVRHPIYLSMMCMLVMNVAMAGTLPLWPVAIALGLVGTEIRVRVEDALLRERFGDQFDAWQKRVPAYLPFVR